MCVQRPLKSAFEDRLVPAYLATLEKHYDRRQFRTEQHRFGTSHKSLRVGDEIWLLAGAKVPFVLRRLPNDDLSLIGEAYVDGMMSGELWPESETELVDIVLE